MKWKIGLLLFLTSQLQAQDFYADASSWFGIDPNAGQNSFLTLVIPSGGRYESMASAYTALAMDSGYMESNPAGGSFLKNKELVFFHVDWIADSAIESLYYSIRPEKNDNFGIGIGFKFLHVPFTGYNNWGAQTSSVGWYSESIGTLSVSYGFIKDYYGSNILSIGTSLKVGYRGVQASLEPGQSAVSVMGDIGIMSRFNLFKGYASRDTNFSIGISFKNFGVEFIDNADPLPTQITTGIAWKFIRPITMALDFSVPINLDGSDSEMVSGAIGFDFNVTRFLDIQAGLLLKQGKPRFTLGSQVSMKDFDLIFNYTLDLATQLELFNRMSVGVRINLDSARSLIIRDEVQDLYLTGLKEYSNGNGEKALNYLYEAEKLNPNYRPVKDMIYTIEESLSLENDLRDSIRE